MYTYIYIYMYVYTHMYSVHANVAFSEVGELCGNVGVHAV